MNVEKLKVPATDGYLLAGTLYRSGQEEKIGRFVLINSAMGVKRRYYNSYARFLCESGFTVVTFDYRGIGDSRPRSLRRLEATLRGWAEKDIAGMVEWIQSEHQPEKLFLIGHSVGGQLLGLIPNNKRITAFLAVAAQSGYWRFWPFPRNYLLAALWYVLIPTLTRMFSYFPAKRLGLSEDLPAGVALQWARWGRDPHYIVDDEGRPIRQYFESFKAPILFYSVEDDGYAPKGSVEYLMNCFVNASRKRRHLRPGELGVKSIGHFGFFQERFKSLVWPETADWLQNQ